MQQIKCIKVYEVNKVEKSHPVHSNFNSTEYDLSCFHSNSAS